jgi:hypothetical protein
MYLDILILSTSSACHTNNREREKNREMAKERERTSVTDI